MRFVVLSVVVLAALAAGLAVAQEGEEAQKAEPMSVEGTLVDMKCYSMNPENTGMDHVTPKGKMPACATACAKMGLPVGVLVRAEDGDRVVVLITPGTALADHMAKQARVSGMPALDGHGILPEKIEVKSGDKWEEVKIATMM